MPDQGRDRLSGRTVCAPRAGGRYGAEYSRAGKGKTCLVYGQSETVKKIDFIGSVVTRSIPEKAVAFGNLCRVHHYLETIAEMEADS